MVYTGLNENEIQKIRKILDEFKVVYSVSSNEEVLEKIGSMSEEEQNQFRKQSKRSGHALMQVEIDLEEFKKIHPQMKDRLHALGIYEEVESPFTEEDLEKIADEPPKPRPVDPYAKYKQWAIFGAIALYILTMLARKIFKF
jgi:ElaB/YqjD/DUF883 family membrane-anchored ribosome-binding protein